MAELDIEALKWKTQRSNRRGGWISLPGREVDAIIAALEDRERLRAAAQKILDDACHDPRIYPGELVVFGRYVDALRAALEDRDG